ncbi:hypothetical protein LINPERPRIM_LOCUS7242 [Linum perenne]
MLFGNGSRSSDH